MTAKKIIGITGPLETNFGDYAMFLNNIYDIKPKKIKLYTYTSKFTNLILENYNLQIEYDVLNLILYKDFNIPSNNSKKTKSIIPFNPPTETPMDILASIENLTELRASMMEIDLLLVSGGGFLNHLWKNGIWRNEMLKKIVASILVANELNKKIIFTGNTIGPFDQSEEFFFYFFNILKDTTFYVRDELYSRKYLTRLGIKNEIIKFVPDDLYFVNNKILKRDTSIPKNLLSIGKYIILEVYYSVDYLRENKDMLIDFIDSMYLKYEINVLFIPFDTSMGGSDQGIYLQSISKKIHLYDINNLGYLPIENAVELIKKSELIICNRYHALTLALSLKTPVLNVIKSVIGDHRYYFNKNYSIIQYTFNGLDIRFDSFLKTNLEQTLNYVKLNLMHIIAEQNAYFKSSQSKKNRNILKSLRAKLIEHIQI